MKKRCLAIWLVLCMVFLAMPMDGLYAIANTVVEPESTYDAPLNIESASDNNIEGAKEPERVAGESITLDGLTYEVNSDNISVTLVSGSDSTITELTIPATVTGSDDYVYTVTEIDSYVFKDYTRLKTVTLPSGLTKLGTFAFKDCTSLESIVIPNSLTTIVSGSDGSPFVGCTNLSSVTFEEGITAIPSYIFYKHTALKSVVIPEGVTEIGSVAFGGCSALSDITIPEGLTTIGVSAFTGCTSLETIELPSTLTKLSNFAFNGCSLLNGVELPSGLTKLGTSAFKNCTSLTSIVIPNTLTTITDGSDGSPFVGCTNLASITFEEGIATIPNYIFYEYTTLTSIVIPEGVTEIGNVAFGGCSALSDITIPEGVTTIGTSAFAGCTSLETIELPSTLTKLSNFAFNGCSLLNGVELPSGLTKLGTSAFKNCTSLTSIVIPNTLTTISDGSDGSPFVGCTKLASITFEEGIATIPNYIFYKYTTLTSIVIPEGVTEIGNVAFGGCSALSDITIPEGVTTIGTSAFTGCTSLKTIELPSTLTKLSNFAFNGCSELSGVELPSGLTKLGTSAFKNCTSLKSIVIPKSLTTITDGSDGSPFVGCANLSSITFEEGITTIPNYTFHKFTTLTSITIPEGVTEIGTSVFNGCTSLVKVSLPDGLKKIGNTAFASCTALKEIYIPHTVNSIGTNVFNKSTYAKICANKDTHASVYAIDNGIDFEWIGGEPKNAEDTFLNRNSCQYITDSQNSANGYISYQVDYGFKTNVASGISKMNVYVYIPSNVALVESSVMEDGIISTDFSVDGNVVTIPVSATTGTIKYKVQQNDYEPSYSYATIRFYRGGSYSTEVIGCTEAKLTDLSLVSDEETDSPKFEVHGIALPGNTVKVYLGDTLNSTVKASKSGVYNASVTIPSPKNYKTYVVKVVSTGLDGTEIEVSKKVTYIEGTPKLTSFVMQHNGQEYSLTELKGLKPIVTFAQGSEFVFTAGFDHRESIDDVYFVSTRSNIEKKMKAAWDEEMQVYKASGFFDNSNKSYVPGTITVEYIRKGQTSYLEQDIDFTQDEYVNSLPDELSDAKVQVVTNTESEIRATLNFPSLNDEQVEISVVTEDIPEGLTEENAAEYGYQKIGEEELATVLAAETGPGIDRGVVTDSIFFKEVKDEVTGQMKAQILDFAKEKASTVSGYSSIVDMCDGYSNVSDWLETGITYKNNRMAINEAREIINTSNWSVKEKEAALEHLEVAKMQNNKKVALQVASTILAVAGITNPALSLTIGALSFFTDCRLEMTMLDVNSLVSKTSGSAQINFRWAIDPSGYVYDADTSERLSGVAVTLYYKEAEDSTPVIWDASEYLQLNPLITAADGTYAWDVPEGWWQVKAEKTGYETAYSEWLPVPPPQTEVNLALKKMDDGENDDKESESDGDLEQDDAQDKPSSIPDKSPDMPNQPIVTPIKVNKITLSGISKKIAVGKKIRLTATVLPSNAANKALVWKSSNTKYATVNSVGMVSVKKAGIGKKVTITATAKDGSGVKATYKIKIMKHKVTSVRLKASKKTVKAGKTVSVKATVRTNGKKVNKTLKWTSSNTKYATVTKKGVVKTKKAGKGKTVTITATSTDGTNKKAKIKIKIK